MNKYTIIKTVVSMLIIGFVFSCNDDDNYDWNKVVPGDQKITEIDEDSAKLALDTIDGNNYTINSYKAISRGGSKYAWITMGYPLSIIQRENQPFIVDVKADSRVDTFTWIKVTETTNSGISGKPDSTKILIIGFCSYNLNEILGNGYFTSKMGYYAPYKTTLSVMAGDTLVNNNFFNMRWQLKYVLSKDYEQKITIPDNQKFEYNGEEVFVKGKGYYNTCKGLLVVDFAVCHVYGGDTLQYGSGIDSLLKK